jgi:SSS family solute:Na+ symporter
MHADLIDWLIIAAVLAGTLLYGVFFASARVRSDTEFYLGHRTTHWLLIGFSVAATYFSAIGFLGGTAWGYKDGLAVVLISVNYPLVIVVVNAIFLPFFFNSGCASIFEYQERRFGPIARTTVATIFLLTQLLQSGAIVFAAASVCEFMTGIDLMYSVALMTAIVFAYTVSGGTTAVIKTDVVQWVIMFGGTAIILATLLWFVASNAPAGIAATNPIVDFLRAQQHTNAMVTSLSPSVVATIWTGIFGMGVYHVAVYGLNQMIVQRALAAKTLTDAKKSYLFAGYTVGACAALFPIIGTLIFGYYRGAAFVKPNTIILQYAQDIHIPGLVGITTVAVIAAAMSTMSSSVNSLATISTIDFYQRFLARNRSPEHYLKVSRLSTGLWALLIVVPSFLYTRTTGTSILETLSEFGSYFVGAKLSMFLLGFYSKHTSERGLLAGVIVGLIAIVLIETNTDIAWPWFSLIGVTVTAPVCWLASIAIDGRRSEHSRHSIPGQLAEFRANNRPLLVDGWYVVPGKVDRASYGLLLFFALTVLGLAVADWYLNH